MQMDPDVVLSDAGHVASLTRPKCCSVVHGVFPGVPAGRSWHHWDQHIQQHIHRPGRLWTGTTGMSSTQLLLPAQRSCTQRDESSLINHWWAHSEKFSRICFCIPELIRADLWACSWWLKALFLLSFCTTSVSFKLITSLLSVSPTSHSIN